MELASWLIIIALVFFIIVYLYWEGPKNNQFEQPNAARYKNRKTDEDSPDCLCKHSCDDKEKRHEHKHRDHEKIFWGFSTVLNIITIVVATLAAAFAFQSLKDGHLALVAVQRAFVFSGDFHEKFVRSGPDSLSFTPIWENSGNSPTVNLEIRTHCLLTGHMTSDPETDPRSPNTKIVAKRLLGPSSKVPGVTCSIQGKQIVYIMGGNAILYITRIANYRDVFGMPHITERCDRVLSLTGDVVKDENVGFFTTPCETHNCADKLCAR